MSFLENIKLIASELTSMSPRTQLEIVKLCKELCIEVKNYLVELDETTLTNITTRITNLESATTSLQNLYNELADELQTAEGNITANANAIETLQTSVQTITEALEGIYTKSQVDTLLSAKADKLDTYTKTEVNNLLSAKADASNVYAKADTYNKTEVNTLLNDKADKSTTYTKTQVDTALNGKASLSGNNTFTGTNTFNDTATFESDVVFNGETSIDNELHLDNPTKIYFNDDSKTLSTKLSEKQDVLTAGSGISIVNNVISATGGGGGATLYLHRFTFIVDDNSDDYYIYISPITSPKSTSYTINELFSLIGGNYIPATTDVDGYDQVLGCKLYDTTTLTLISSSNSTIGALISEDKTIKSFTDSVIAL